MEADTQQAPFPALSERQCQCLELRSRRLTLKEIGQELGLSPHTVDGHLEAAQRLLGASTRREAVEIYAAKSGEDHTGEYFGLVSPASPLPVGRRPDAIPQQLNDIHLVGPLELEPGPSAQRGHEQHGVGWGQFVQLVLSIAMLLVLALVIFDTLERLVLRLF